MRTSLSLKDGDTRDFTEDRTGEISKLRDDWRTIRRLRNFKRGSNMLKVVDTRF